MTQPTPSLQDCKEQVAQNHNYDDWDMLLSENTPDQADVFITELCDLYAAQSGKGVYSEEQVILAAYKFFYHWYNVPGTNTEEGARKWIPEFLASLRTGILST